MTALSETAPTAIAYDSLNSTLAETGWRLELVTDEQGGEKTLYFPLTEAEFLHPQEGCHLPSNTFHENTRTEIKEILQRRYAQREDVGVFGDLIVKWGIEGLEDHCPDVCVVFGLRQKEADRSEFIVSEEGTKPVVVMEIVSPRYRKADRETKVKEYARAGVEEYIIIDRRRQRGQLLDEVLSYRLEEGSYGPIAPDEEGRIFCQALDVWIGMFEGKVMLLEGATGEPLPTPQALEQLAEQERQRAGQERQRAQRLAERLRQLGINPDEV
ncbi:MAG: Uma2 family endonuclease [Pseudanabaena sp. RU_4_16]|nr:Uma2 family endonuclease [Pseudanabaena sp. RU_4_16]